MRFLGDPKRIPGSSHAVIQGIHEGRVVVRIDGFVLGILEASISSCVKSISADVLGSFSVGCAGDDAETGLVQVVIPSRQVHDSMHLARVLDVWEYTAEKKTKREVRVFLKTASGVLGVASASEYMNWALPAGQHVTVEFKPTPLLNPPSETNCTLVGVDFRGGQPPAEGSTVDAVVVKVQPYGAFCLVANCVQALMHRNDCGLDRTQDVTQHFCPGDRVRGVIQRYNKAEGTLRFRLKGLLEKRPLPTWSALCGLSAEP
jgi:hypothetical protein